MGSNKEFDNNMKGVLFINNRKDFNNKDDKKPDWSGSAEIDGKDMWASGWKAVDKKGNERINLRFSHKEEEIPF